MIDLSTALIAKIISEIIQNKLGSNPASIKVSELIMAMGAMVLYLKITQLS